MDKIIHLSLARKSTPVFMDIVQSATAPSVQFVLDDFTPASGSTARLYIKKGDAEVYNSCTLTGNIVKYTPTAGSFDVPGDCVAQLQIVKGNTVAVSYRIFTRVEPNLIEGSAAPASTEYDALTDMVVEAQEVIDQLENYDGIVGANNITGFNNRQGWIALTSGQDLNSITTPGVYYASTNAIAASLGNCPMPLSFVMIVEATINGNNYLRQRILSPHASPEYDTEWQRKMTGATAGWQPWILNPKRDEVNAIANRGGKNLLGNSITTQTINGMTFTVNPNRSITVNGTATADTNFISGMYELPMTRYHFNGCPNGGSASSFYTAIEINTGGGYAWANTARDYGEGLAVNAAVRRFAITVVSGTTINNLTFYPMIRDASIQDNTYVPYGMSNAELTENAIVKTGTLTNTEELTSNNLIIRQQGKVVSITGIIKFNSSLGTTTKVIGVLQGVSYPPASVRGIGIAIGTTASLCGITLGSTGTLSAVGYAADIGRDVAFNISYIAN